MRNAAAEPAPCGGFRTHVNFEPVAGPICKFVDDCRENTG